MERQRPGAQRHHDAGSRRRSKLEDGLKKLVPAASEVSWRTRCIARACPGDRVRHGAHASPAEHGSTRTLRRLARRGSSGRSRNGISIPRAGIVGMDRGRSCDYSSSSWRRPRSIYTLFSIYPAHRHDPPQPLSRSDDDRRRSFVGLRQFRHAPDRPALVGAVLERASATTSSSSSSTWCVQNPIGLALAVAPQPAAADRRATSIAR